MVHIHIAAGQEVYQNDRFKSSPLWSQGIDNRDRFHKSTRFNIGLCLSNRVVACMM